MLWRGAPLLLLAVLVVVPSEARATITFVQTVGTAGSQTVGTTLTIPVGVASVEADDTLIVTLALDPASGPVSCIDSAGNTYTVDANAVRGSGTSGVRTVVFSSLVTTPLGPGDTITVTHPSVVARAACVYEFAGVSVPDQTATGAGSGTSPVAGPTALTSQSDELLFGAVAMEAKKTDPFTPGAGYAGLLPEHSGIGGVSSASVAINAEYRVVATTGTYSASGTIIAHEWAAAVVAYRGVACGNGVVEPGEQCDDGNLTAGDCCDPACQFEDASVVCRDAAGPCDVPETCTGDSGGCPFDEKSTDECRAAVDDCDLAESCDGVADDCPPDGFADASVACREAAGDCDLPEYCTGNDPSCPDDEKRTDECRPASDACDVAESCDGVSDDCPDDLVLADTDGDGICDEQDYCVDVPDAQTDRDGDGVDDACDPCTNNPPVWVEKPTLEVRPIAKGGTSKFKLSGIVTVPANPPLDPTGKGVRVILQELDGFPVLDADAPGGDSWRQKPSRHAWRFRDPFGRHVLAVDLRTTRTRPDRVKFKISGIMPHDPIAEAGPALQGTIVLDAPYATTGQCGEGTFPMRWPAAR